MKTIEWDFLVVGYLFLGGLSAGLFFVSALATLVLAGGFLLRYILCLRGTDMRVSIESE